MKKSAWIGLGLVLLAGVVIIGQWRGGKPTRVDSVRLNPDERNAILAATRGTAAVASVKSESGDGSDRTKENRRPVDASGGDEATNTASLTSVEIDPQYPYRLRNTDRPAKELFTSDSAIVLRNALIDSAEPVSRLQIPDHLRAKGDPGRYIVQANGRTSDAFRSLLTKNGAEIVSYIPNNAYLVQASGEAVTRIRQSPLVLNAVTYEPYYKLSAALLPGAVQDSPMPAGQPLRLGLFPGTEDDVIARLQASGAVIAQKSRFPYGPLVTVIPRPDQLVAIAGMPEVQLLEIYPRYRLLRELGRVRVGAVNPAVPNVNLHGLDGSGVIVGVNGTGVQTNHVDFDTRVIVDTTNYATPFADGSGHETHVAGIIAANGSTTPGSYTNGSVVGANYAGVAPAAKIFPLSIFPATGEEVIGTSPTTGATGAITGITVTFESAGYREAPSVFIFDTTPYTTNASGEQLTPGANASYTANLTDGRVTSFTPVTYGSNYTATNTVIVLTSPWDEFQTITNQARNTNVYIVNNSWSVSVQEYDTTAAIYDAAVRDSMPHWAGEQAINYVFAGGNSGFGATDGKSGLADSIESPATAKNVITVGAIESLRNISTPAGNTNAALNNVLAETDSNDQVADFSSRGNVGVGLEGEYGRFKPDLVAPGSWVLSSSVTNYTNGTVIDNQINNTALRYESGTSMAAPFVSGLLALMQQAFDSSPFNRTNSPALNKAMLINSARPAGTQYDYSPRNFINYQGWGVPALSNALPDVNKVKLLETISGSQSATVVLLDQGGLSTNYLRTGQTHNFDVSVSDSATNQSLRITLAWTDPPGNPTAGIKLVNNLDLLVSNKTTSEVFVGNFIPSGSDFTVAGSLDNPNNLERAVSDYVNNVENVYIRGPFTNGANDFRIYVTANRVNVNATGHATNDVEQDYVLVVSTTEDAQVTLSHEPTADIATNNPTQFLLNGIPVFEQRVGGNSPFVTNSLMGITNQWNFFVFTNNFAAPDPITNVATNISGTITNQSTNVVKPLAGGANVAFATFYPPNVGRSRNVDGDVDLYVTRASSPPPGGQISTNNLALSILTSPLTLRSTNRGGVEFITLNDSTDGEVFYIGVKSEDQQAAQYSFLALATSQQFTTDNGDGTYDVALFSVPSEIPDGNPGAPSGTNIFGMMTEIKDVYQLELTTTIDHENHADLSVSLIHNNVSVNLWNHTQRNQQGGSYDSVTRVFDSALYNTSVATSGAELADGPGNLEDFTGESAFGLWILEATDDALNHTGALAGASLRIGDDTAGRNRTRNGNQTQISFNLDPGESFIDFIYVDVTVTNLKVSVSGAPNSDPGIDLFVAYNQVPPAPFFTNSFTTNINGTNYAVTNVTANGNVISLFAPNTSASQIELDTGTSPVIRVGPWFARVVNNTSSQLPLILIFEVEHNYGIGGFDSKSETLDLDLVDLASTNLTVTPEAYRTIADLEVAIGVEHPRPADLIFELFSPSGTRVLLAENRGDLNRTNIFANFAEGTNAFTSMVDDPALGTMVHFDELLPIKAITNQFTNVVSPPLLLTSNTVNLAGVHTYPQAIYSPGNALFLAGSLRTNGLGTHTNWGMVLSYNLPFTNNMSTNWLTNWPGPMNGPVFNQGSAVSFGDIAVNTDGVFMVANTNADYFPVVQSAAGGPEPYVLDYDTGCQQGTFNFTIDTYTVPDHYHVYFRGSPLLSVDYPGVGANTSYALNFNNTGSPSTRSSFVRLVINQGSNTASGTAWALSGVSATCASALSIANRGLIVGYPTAGPATGSANVATNGAIMISRGITNHAYGYAGDDRLFGISTAEENGTNMLYVVGSAQVASSGDERFFISKLDTSGNMYWTSTEQVGAAATLSVGSSGEITGATIVCPGTNYSSAPSVNIVDLHSLGSGASASATIGPNGNVTAISISSQGSGYQAPAIYIDKPSSSGSRPSAGYDVMVSSNELIIAVGTSNNVASGNSVSPIVWAYDTNGCLLWTRDAGFDNGGAIKMNGGYKKIGARESGFFAIGSSNDFSANRSYVGIHEWDYSGNLLNGKNYSHINGTPGDSRDSLNDMVVMRNPDRIYAVGTRTNSDSSTDAFLLEIDPDTLNALSTTVLDDGGNEYGRAVTTDGRDLYVVLQTHPGGQATTKILRFRVKNFYLPEESLNKFQGELSWYSSGNYLRTNWTLRITDTREGGTSGITPKVKYWGINFSYAAVGAGYSLITTDRGFTGSILSRSAQYFTFDVAPGTTEVTLHTSSDNPVSIAISDSGLPALGDSDSVVLAQNQPGGTYVLSDANGFSLRPGRYYLLVQPGLEASGGTFSLSLQANPPGDSPTIVPLLENGVSTAGHISAGPGLSYYSFTVPEGATGARFELATAGDDLNLYLRKTGATNSLPSITEFDARSITVGASDEVIFLIPDAASTNALSPGTWFLAVENKSAAAKEFAVKATSFAGSPFQIIAVADGGRESGVAPAGNAPAVMYRLDVAAPERGLLFEVSDLDGNGDLIVRKGSPPLLAQYTAASANGGNNNERAVIRTNAIDSTLVGEWYFGILNREERMLRYAAVAKKPTDGLLLSDVPTLISSSSTRVLETTLEQHFGFDFNVVPGERYQVQYSPVAQGPWFVLTNIVAPPNGAIEFVHEKAVANPKLFYRVQQVP